MRETKDRNGSIIGESRKEMAELTPEQLAAISRLFSSSVIREMARGGRSPLFARFAIASRLLDSIPKSERVYNLFEAAFALLKRVAYRDEYVYKAALTQKILLARHSLRTASMLTEFRVGLRKADLVILNGTSTAYEVKSERDSLTRLERQVAAYAEVFSSVYVIAAEDHIDAVIRLVPKEVGIMRLNERYRISTLREAADQPERTSPSSIFDSIRTEEARIVLQLNGVPIPPVPNTMLRSALRPLFAALEPRKAHEGMIHALKKTRNLLPLSELVANLPSSLHTAALSVPLRKVDRARLVAAVCTRLEDAVAWG